LHKSQWHGDAVLSRKAKYALKALIYLAERPPSQPAVAADIAEPERLPKKFLDTILLTLRKHEILHSRRGKHGGYVLALPPEKISLADVIRLMDGPLAPVLCVSKTAYHRCADCRDEGTCRIRILMRDVRDGILGVLEQRTLADLVALAATSGDIERLLPETWNIGPVKSLLKK
jgi:Rrf2 family protein